MSSNHRERVQQALCGQRSDRPACGEFFVADEFVRAFVTPAIAGPVEFQHQRTVVQELDLDIATVPFSSGWGTPEQPDEDQALARVDQWHADGSRYLLALIDGPFSIAAKARGFNMLVHYVHGAPHLVSDLMQRGADECRVVAQAVRDAGADGVILGEDIAYGRSTYFSPQHLRARYFPALARAAREIRALGLAVFFHSDGNLDAILEDLAVCDLNGLQGLEPEAGMTVPAARERVGPALALWGNLGFEFMSRPRTDAEIVQALSALRARPAPRGAPGEPANSIPDLDAAHIIGSCAGLVQGMDPDTVRRVYRLATQLP
jgi:uroporphyrinogen decarboxylase